jgi:hypothetical protein
MRSFPCMRSLGSPSSWSVGSGFVPGFLIAQNGTGLNLSAVRVISRRQCTPSLRLGQSICFTGSTRHPASQSRRGFDSLAIRQHQGHASSPRPCNSFTRHTHATALRCLISASCPGRKSRRQFRSSYRKPHLHGTLLASDRTAPLRIGPSECDGLTPGGVES